LEGDGKKLVADAGSADSEVRQGGGDELSEKPVLSKAADIRRKEEEKNANDEKKESEGYRPIPCI